MKNLFEVSRWCRGGGRSGRGGFVSASKKLQASELNSSAPQPAPPRRSIHLPGPSIDDPNLLSVKSLGFFFFPVHVRNCHFQFDSTRLSETRRFGGYPAERSGLCAARRPSLGERERGVKVERESERERR